MTTSTSTSHLQVALASSRVTVTCMAMGQAAGTAARELGMPELQRRLLDDGAIILDHADAVRAAGDALGQVAIDASH